MIIKVMNNSAPWRDGPEKIYNCGYVDSPNDDGLKWCGIVSRTPIEKGCTVSVGPDVSELAKEHNPFNPNYPITVMKATDVKKSEGGGGWKGKKGGYSSGVSNEARALEQAGKLVNTLVMSTKVDGDPGEIDEYVGATAKSLAPVVVSVANVFKEFLTSKAVPAASAGDDGGGDTADKGDMDDIPF
jgi:hypothetical protein